MTSQQTDLDSIHVTLTEWLGSKLPTAQALTLSPLRKPGLGFSNETLLGELSWREDGEDRSEGLVFRLEPTAFLVFPEYDLPRQVRVMQCLGETETPVPVIRWLEEDEQILGRPFYVMQEIEGEIPSDVPFYHSSGFCVDATPARREQIWWGGLETLAGIHALDWEAVGLDFLGVPAGGSGPIDQQLDYYGRFLQWARGDEPQPILDAALVWLRENRYSPKRVTLCWGDARLPNLIFRDGKVVGVLDWEMAFLGDPEADLAWWLFLDWHHSEGNGTPRLEGFPGREETIRRYEELTGWQVEQLLYNEVLAGFRFGVIMVSIYRNMRERGVSLAGATSPIIRRLASLLDLPLPTEASGG